MNQALTQIFPWIFYAISVPVTFGFGLGLLMCTSKPDSEGKPRMTSGQWVLSSATNGIVLTALIVPSLHFLLYIITMIGVFCVLVAMTRASWPLKKVSASLRRHWKETPGFRQCLIGFSAGLVFLVSSTLWILK